MFIIMLLLFLLFFIVIIIIIFIIIEIKPQSASTPFGPFGSQGFRSGSASAALLSMDPCRVWGERRAADLRQKQEAFCINHCKSVCYQTAKAFLNGPRETDWGCYQTL